MEGLDWVATPGLAYPPIFSVSSFGGVHKLRTMQGRGQRRLEISGESLNGGTNPALRLSAPPFSFEPVGYAVSSQIGRCILLINNFHF